MRGWLRVTLAVVAGIVDWFAVATAANDALRALGVVLLVLFIPVHVRLWDTFRAWYHAVFLLSLVPLAWIGARRPLQA